MPKTKLTQDIYSCQQLARLAQVDYGVVRDCCNNGQIPLCKKRQRMWIISREGADFFLRWVKRLLKGDLAGKIKMRIAAAEVDPSVLDRQPELQNRLSPVQVRDIRRRARKGESLDSIGECYGRTRSAMSRIVGGLRYAEV